MDVQGVVFDLDATLVNLGGFVDWREAHRRVVKAYLGCGCSEEMVSSYSREGLFNMLNLMCNELYNSYPREDVERIQGRAYSEITRCEVEGISKCSLMPGCLEVLEWLREREVKLGVATSNDQRIADLILNKNGVKRFFQVIVGRTPRLRMKPSPDQIFACFHALCVDPQRGVVVGDSVKDMIAAKAAGCYAIAVPAYFTKRELLTEAGADRIIETLEDLPDILLRLQLNTK